MLDWWLAARNDKSDLLRWPSDRGWPESVGS